MESDFDTTFRSVAEDVRQRYETAWLQGNPRPIDEFLPPVDDRRYLATLEELIHIELEFCWKDSAGSP